LANQLCTYLKIFFKTLPFEHGSKLQLAFKEYSPVFRRLICVLSQMIWFSSGQFALPMYCCLKTGPVFEWLKTGPVLEWLKTRWLILPFENRT
jgi:hypothetical protein